VEDQEAHLAARYSAERLEEDMSPKTLDTERAGRVLTVHLDNPPRNFMTGRMVHELHDLVSGLEGDRSVGSVVITGADDDVFITHFDVDEIRRGSTGVGATISPAQAGGGLRAIGAAERLPGLRSVLERTPMAGIVTLRLIHDLFLRMNRLDKVIIAAINGLALGGGCELALACDIRMMAEGEGRIGLPETTLGIIPGAGGTQRMTRTLGPGKALELMLEGRALSPEEAREVGLVHRTVASASLTTEAQATAARLARRSNASIGALKRAVYDGGSRPLEAGLHVERAGFLATASTAAARRAMETYADELERLGDVAPWQTSEVLERWQEGTAVDLTT
jgi:enoyl-CoA hydratase